jgi:drug/metabolite transporter (DMT)-like permease
MWFLIAILGYFLLAVVFVLDKFILTKSVQSAAVYTFYSTIFMFGALFAYPLGVELLAGNDWLVATLSGLTFGFGLWVMYIAVKIGETSHITPFVGAWITIATYAIASIFLGEQLTALQIAGMALLVMASLILSFERSRAFNGFHIGFVWAALAGILFAVSHTSAKYIYESYPFLTGFVWTRATTGLVGLFLLCSPAVLRTFRRKKKKAKTYAKRHVIQIVVSAKALGVFAVIALQYAIAAGSVTLVNAMGGIQYVLMFLMILFLTMFFPKVFKEYITRREKIVQSIALLLVAIGSALFVL